MIKKEIESLNITITEISKENNAQKIYRYFNNKEYLAVFLKQFKKLVENLESINILCEAGKVDDAFTILRKYLETYFIMSSIINKPDLACVYVEHEKYISKKACGNDKEGLRAFVKGKPDGYLQYGYIDKYIDQYGDLSYNLYSISRIGGVSKHYKIYSLCNNFVHNNLTSVSTSEANGKKKIEQSLCLIVSEFIRKIHNIIDK